MRPFVLLLVLVLLATATVAWTDKPEPPEANREAALSDHARDALVPNCGSCHRSDLPTAKAGALAVFDLTKDPWWATIKDDQYDDLLRRVRGTSGVTDEDKAAIEAFVAAIRPPSPPTPEP